jgi:hypothetical protein
MPDILAGLRLERDDRCDKKVVAALGAADTFVPRTSVAHSDVEQVEFGIVNDDGLPGSFAMTPHYREPLHIKEYSFSLALQMDIKSPEPRLRGIGLGH